MIIIAGKLYVASERRDEYLAKVADVAALARRAEGCLLPEAHLGNRQRGGLGPRVYVGAGGERCVGPRRPTNRSGPWCGLEASRLPVPRERRARQPAVTRRPPRLVSATQEGEGGANGEREGAARQEALGVVSGRVE
jgi:hypothetical protein